MIEDYQYTPDGRVRFRGGIRAPVRLRSGGGLALGDGPRSVVNQAGCSAVQRLADGLLVGFGVVSK